MSTSARIRGFIRTARGTPPPSARAELFACDLVDSGDGAGVVVRRTTLGTSTADQDGRYVVPYTVPTDPARPLDLVVVATYMDDAGPHSFESDIVFRAPPELTLDLVEGGRPVERSEHERVRKALDGVLSPGRVRAADLDRATGRFAARASDTSEEEVLALSAAERDVLASDQAGHHVDVHVWYALRRAGLRGTTSEIAQRPSTVLRETLARASGIGTVGRLDSRQMDAAIDALRRLGASAAMESAAQGVSGSHGSLAGLLRHSRTKSDVQERYLREVLAGEPRGVDVDPHTSADGVSPEDRRELDFAVQSGMLLRGDLALLEALRRRRDASGSQTVSTTRDMAAWSDQDWSRLLRGAAQGGHGGERDAEVHERIVDAARTGLRRLHPDVAFVRSLARERKPVSHAYVRRLLHRKPELRGPIQEERDWGDIPNTERRAALTEWDAFRFACRAFPSLSPEEILRRAEDGDDPTVSVRRDAARVLGKAREVDLRKQSVRHILREQPAVFDGIAGKDRPAIVEHLAALQRMLVLTGDPETAERLVDLGIQSAAQITRQSPGRFTRVYSGLLGGEDAAAEVYRRADKHAGIARSLEASVMLPVALSRPAILDADPDALAGLGAPHGEHSNQRDPARRALENAVIHQFSATGDAPDVATWEVLFGGSGSYCACQDCLTVFSPAAYLVDLLRSLDPSDGSGDDFPTTPGIIGLLEAAWPSIQSVFFPTPLQVLRARRPDLTRIPLSCANTHTLLPTIDLVNELLAREVAPPTEGGPETVSDVGEATAEELAAAPKNSLAAALTKLEGVSYPMTLPFQRDALVARTYARELGISLGELADLYLSDASGSGRLTAEERIAADTLGLDEKQFKLVARGLRTNDDKLDVAGSFGFKKDAGLTATLNRVPEFLARTRLTYAEMVDLAKTWFVNPTQQRVLEVPDDGCDYTHSRLVGLGKSHYDRVHRFVRLWRATGWPMEDVDRGLFAVCSRDHTGTPTIDARALVNLAHVRRIASATGASLAEAAGFMHEIDAWGPASVYAGMLSRMPETAPSGSASLALEQSSPQAGLTPHGPSVPYSFVAGTTPPAPPFEDAEVSAFLGCTQSDLNHARVLIGNGEVAIATFGELCVLHRVLSLCRRLDMPVSDLHDLLVRDRSSVKAWLAPTEEYPIEDRLRAVDRLVQLKGELEQAKLGATTLAAMLRYRTDAIPVSQPAEESNADRLHRVWRSATTEAVDRALLLLQRRLYDFDQTATDVPDVGAWLAGRVPPDVVARAVQKLADLEDALGKSSAADLDDALGTSSAGGAAISEACDWFESLALFPGLREAAPTDAVALRLALRRIMETATRRQARASAVDDALATTLGAPVTLVSAVLDLLSSESGSESEAERAEKRLGAREELVSLGDAHGWDHVLAETTVTQGTARIQGKDVTTGPSHSPPRVGDPGQFLKEISSSANAKEDSTVEVHLGWCLRFPAPGKVTLAWAHEGTVWQDHGVLTGKSVVDLGGGEAPPLQVEVPSEGALFKFYSKLTGTFPVPDESVPGNGEPKPASGTAAGAHWLTWQWEGRDPERIPAWAFAEPFGATSWEDLAKAPDDPTTSLTVVAAAIAYCTTLGIGASDLGMDKLKERLIERLLGPTLETIPDELEHAVDTLRIVRLLPSGQEDRRAAVDAHHDLSGDELERHLRKETVRRRAGVPEDVLRAWAADPGEKASEIEATVRARHADPQSWFTTAKRLNDPIREATRDALVAYLLPRFDHPKGSWPLDDNSRWDHDTPDDLSSYFLIDVQVSACARTSRIKQAISSVQQFVQRCLLGLERSPPEDIDAEAWAWRKSYRVWEANRRIFLYPENWIRPELRTDQTPFFKELSSALLQAPLDDDHVEDAFETYLHGMVEVSGLEVTAIYWDKDWDEDGVDDVHVIGQSRNLPPTFWHRRLVDRQEWTPWEKLDLDIETEPGTGRVHMALAKVSGRVALTWLTFTEVPETEQPDATDVHPPPLPLTHWDVRVAWSLRRKTGWGPRRMSTQAMSVKRHFPLNGEDGQTLEQMLLTPLWGARLVEWTRKTPLKRDVEFLEQMLQEYNSEVKKYNKDALYYPGVIDRRLGHDFRLNDAPRTSDFGSPDSHVDEWLTGVEELLAFVENLGPDFISDLELELEGNFVETKVCKVIREPIEAALVAARDVRALLGPMQVAREDVKRLESVNGYLRRLKLRSGSVQVPDWSKVGDYSFWIRPGKDGVEACLLNTRSSVSPGPKFKVSAISAIPSSPALTIIPKKALPVVGAPALSPHALLLSPSGKIYVGVDALFSPRPGESDKNTLLTEHHTWELASSTGPRARPVAISRQNSESSVTTYVVVFDGTVKETDYMPMEVFETTETKSIVKTAWVEAGTTTSPVFRVHALSNNLALGILGAFGHKGIPGLFDPDVQEYRLTEPETSFEDAYRPTNRVRKPYPARRVDFDPRSANGVHGWELFFHIPVLIASRLMQEGAFDKARSWLHKVFDPTRGPTEGKSPARRFWNFRPFRTNHDFETAASLVSDLASESPDPDVEAQVATWERHPAEPHRIAQFRVSAYQMSTVFLYVDNLLAWGDSLFARDTMESINEATELYLLASQILGPRPQPVPPAERVSPKTYEQIEFFGVPDVHHFSDPLVPVEELAHPFITEAARDMQLRRSGFARGALAGLRPGLVRPKKGSKSSKDEALYFCVPGNEEMLKRWDLVADRLYKIRHCMNLEGVERQLVLFEPPIDPALLVRAAAAGLDIASVLADSALPVSPYRFSVLLQKASELANEVKTLGQAMLGAIEKRDAERMSALRATQETGLLRMVREVKIKQVAEAESARRGLELTRRVTEVRQTFYANIERVSPKELQSAKLNKESGKFADGAQGAKLAAGALGQVPDFTLGTAGGFATPVATFTVGGKQALAAATVVSDALALMSTIRARSAGLASTEASQDRRWDDWKLQERLAERELAQLDKQLEGAAIRIEIAKQDLANHDRQIENALRVEETLRTKFSNEDLYDWMAGELSSLHRHAYQLAIQMAKRVERAYAFERGVDAPGIIRADYWDGQRRGLLAGERLALDLKRLDIAYMDTHRRDYELVRTVSLVELDPIAFIALKETGSCEFEIPESFWDADYPGHYHRTLRSVAVTIPAVLGPNVPVNATLTLLSHRIRTDASLPGNAYAESPPLEDPRFRYGWSATQRIATSHAQGDAGLFEVNFADGRYLPFEGAGAISKWRLEMGRKQNSFVDTISDVMLRVSYTAKDGGDAVRTAAGSVGSATARLVSVRHEFPTEWSKFIGEGGVGELVLELGKAEERGVTALVEREGDRIRVYTVPESSATTTSNVSWEAWSTKLHMAPGSPFGQGDDVTAILRTGRVSDPLKEGRLPLKRSSPPHDQVEDLFILLQSPVGT